MPTGVGLWQGRDGGGGASHLTFTLTPVPALLVRHCQGPILRLGTPSRQNAQEATKWEQKPNTYSPETSPSSGETP